MCATKIAIFYAAILFRKFIGVVFTHLLAKLATEPIAHIRVNSRFQTLREVLTAAFRMNVN